MILSSISNRSAIYNKEIILPISNFIYNWWIYNALSVVFSLWKYELNTIQHNMLMYRVRYLLRRDIIYVYRCLLPYSQRSIDTSICIIHPIIGQHHITISKTPVVLQLKHHYHEKITQHSQGGNGHLWSLPETSWIGWTWCEDLHYGYRMVR